MKTQRLEHGLTALVAGLLDGCCHFLAWLHKPLNDGSELC